MLRTQSPKKTPTPYENLMGHFDSLSAHSNAVLDALDRISKDLTESTTRYGVELTLDEFRDRPFSTNRRFTISKAMSILCEDAIKVAGISIKDFDEYKTYVRCKNEAKNLSTMSPYSANRLRLMYLRAEAAYFQKVVNSFSDSEDLSSSSEVKKFKDAFGQSPYYQAVLKSFQSKEEGTLPTLEKLRKKEIHEIRVDCSTKALLADAESFVKKEQNKLAPEAEIFKARNQYVRAYRRYKAESSSSNWKGYYKLKFFDAEVTYLTEFSQYSRNNQARVNANKFITHAFGGAISLSNKSTVNHSELKISESISAIIQVITPAFLARLTLQEKQGLSEQLTKHSIHILGYLQTNPKAAIEQLAPLFKKHGDLIGKIFEIPQENGQEKHALLINFIYQLTQQSSGANKTKLLQGLLSLPAVRNALTDLRNVPVENEQLYKKQRHCLTFCLTLSDYKSYLKPNHKQIYDNFAGDLQVHTLLAKASPSKKSGFTSEELSNLKLLTKDNEPAAKLRVKYLTGEVHSPDRPQPRTLLQRKLNTEFMCSFGQEGFDFLTLPMAEATPIQRGYIRDNITQDEKMSEAFAPYRDSSSAKSQEQSRPGSLRNFVMTTRSDSFFLRRWFAGFVKSFIDRASFSFANLEVVDSPAEAGIDSFGARVARRLSTESASSSLSIDSRPSSVSGSEEDRSQCSSERGSIDSPSSEGTPPSSGSVADLVNQMMLTPPPPRIGETDDVLPPPVTTATAAVFNT